jgi:hypothetical protein
MAKAEMLRGFCLRPSGRPSRPGVDAGEASALPGGYSRGPSRGTAGGRPRDPSPDAEGRECHRGHAGVESLRYPITGPLPYEGYVIVAPEGLHSLGAAQPERAPGRSGRSSPPRAPPRIRLEGTPLSPAAS